MIPPRLPSCSTHARNAAPLVRDNLDSQWHTNFPDRSANYNAAHRPAIPTTPEYHVQPKHNPDTPYVRTTSCARHMQHKTQIDAYTFDVLRVGAAYCKLEIVAVSEVSAASSDHYHHVLWDGARYLLYVPCDRSPRYIDVIMYSRASNASVVHDDGCVVQVTCSCCLC
jgi:hypothetical protein